MHKSVGYQTPALNCSFGVAGGDFYDTMKDSGWYAVQESDPPRRTGYNDDPHSCFFVRTIYINRMMKVFVQSLIIFMSQYFILSTKYSILPPTKSQTHRLAPPLSLILQFHL